MDLPYFLTRWYYQWVREIAVRFPDFSMAARDKQRILDELCPKPSTQLGERLIQALEGKISMYKGRSNLEGQLAPRSHVRRTLIRMKKRFDAAADVLDDLDWHTRFALAPFVEGQNEPSRGLRLLSARKPPEMERLDEQLCTLAEQLLRISESANACREKAVPRRGGWQQPTARELLVVDIADTLEELLPGSVAIVTTDGAPFENIVRICLEVADGQFKADAHRLILSSMKIFHSSYRPQGLKHIPGVKNAPT